MQTFLPYADFEKTARVLDYRRLGKQRVETKQILMALNGETSGWVNHPATKMWRGHEFALAYYGSIMSLEWKRRGYVDNLLPYFIEKMRDLTVQGKRYEGLPWFIGNSRFHESHRSNLLRKAPEYYSEFFPDTPSDLPYIWTPEEMSVPRVTVGV